jgi:hypothetical protein
MNKWRGQGNYCRMGTSVAELPQDMQRCSVGVRPAEG